MGAYTTDMKAFRALLSKQMALSAWTQVPLWSQFIGFIGSKGRYPSSVGLGSSETKRLKPTGMPIEMVTNFQHEGSATMDVPVINPLTELPIYGDNQALGNEESQKITYKTVTINQVRKPVLIRTGAMSEQVLKKPEVQKELMTNSKEQLQDFNIRYVGFQPYMALLRRYSDNITASKANGGLGLTPASHPNFYVAGYGKATWSDTPATYETNVATALNSLTDTAACHFSTKTIENAVALASRLKIPRVAINGGKYYIMVTNPDQALQLFSDEKWVNANQYAGPRNDTNRLVTGEIVGLYRGCYIYVDQNAPGAEISGDTNYSSARGTVNYGNANPIKYPVHETNRKLAILLGASAVACGYASPLAFESETWDYNNKKSEASRMIVGFERADIYDTDGYYGTAGNFKENTSSLVIATYSPFTLAWT